MAVSIGIFSLRC